MKIFFMTMMMTAILSNYSLTSAAGVGKGNGNFQGSPPRLLNHSFLSELIQYPKDCKHKGREGRVLIKVLVSTTGDVKEHEILKFSCEDFKNAINETVAEMKFSPATNAYGYPVERWLYLPFKFSLN